MPTKTTNAKPQKKTEPRPSSDPGAIKKPFSDKRKSQMGRATQSVKNGGNKGKTNA